MLRNEASIRELFYRSCTADRSFVPQDDRGIGYVIGRYEGPIRELFYRLYTADRSFVPQDDRKIGYVIPLQNFAKSYNSIRLAYKLINK